MVKLQNIKSTIARFPQVSLLAKPADIVKICGDNGSGKNNIAKNNIRLNAKLHRRGHNLTHQPKPKSPKQQRRKINPQYQNSCSIRPKCPAIRPNGRRKHKHNVPARVWYKSKSSSDRILRLASVL